MRMFLEAIASKLWPPIVYARFILMTSRLGMRIFANHPPQRQGSPRVPPQRRGSPRVPRRDRVLPGSPRRDRVPPESPRRDGVPPGSPTETGFSQGPPRRDGVPPGSPRRDRVGHHQYSLERRDAGDRTENLLPHTARAVRQAGDHRRLQEIALGEQRRSTAGQGQRQVNPRRRRPFRILPRHRGWLVRPHPPCRSAPG